MSARIIKGSAELGRKIRSRRNELGLTIEDAASKAGVGTKTWSRYESGESIRRDKILHICKTLNWRALPVQEETDSSEINIKEYKDSKLWSQPLAETLGNAAAISFVIGSDILLDNITQDLESLSHKPKGTHLGELELSWLRDSLPEQFLTQYDYDFLCYLRAVLMRYQEQAANRILFTAHTVAEELTLYLIMIESEFLMESILPNIPPDDAESNEIDSCSTWSDWPFDLFNDMDIYTFLYGDFYLEKNHPYHFDHWREAQFYCES